MKKTKQYISLLLAAFMAAGLSSCIKEDYAGASDETATVNLVFDTRASGQDGDKVHGEANEGIKTLRVIIVDTEKGIVDVNETRNFSSDGGDEFTKTLTIMGLPAGKKSFYIVANEESVGLELNSSLPKGEINLSDTLQFLQTLVESEKFPRTDIAAKGLPIAGTASANITGAEDQTIEIPITRAVAKMELILTNATGDNFELSQVVLGSFFPDKTYLFPQETELALPDGVAYDDHTFSTNATLSDGESQTFYFYFYESNAGEGAYTIALNNGADYAAAPIMLDEDKPLTSVSRNTCLRVTGTIESALNPVLTDLQLLVKPWTEKNIDVPPFE